MGNRHLFPVDRVDQLTRIVMLVEMGNNLMPEQVEINPVNVTAAFFTAKQATVEFTRFLEIPDRKGEMERP